MSSTHAWIYLLLAIVTEVAGTVAMKLAAGFTFIIPSISIFVCYAFSLVFLTLALKRFDMGFAYAIWSALGTLLIFLIGIGYLHENLTMLKVISLALIIIGVAGLKQNDRH